MASVQILNSTLKNAQYAFRKAGLPCDRGYFLRQLREVFNDNPQICTKNGKFTKDGIFALKRVIEENGLNQASNWDDLAQIIKARREAVRPVKEKVALKVFGKPAFESPQNVQKVFDEHFLELPKELRVEPMKYRGVDEQYIKHLFNKEMASTGEVVDLAKFAKMLSEKNGSVGSQHLRAIIVQGIDALRKAGKTVQIKASELPQDLEQAILHRINIVS